MKCLPAFQMRATLLNLLVVLFIARPISAWRSAEDERKHFPPFLVATYKVASQVISAVQMLEKMMRYEYVAIIQMDPATFPPSTEPQSTLAVFTRRQHDRPDLRHYDPNRPLPRAFRRVDGYRAPQDGPAGRVITDVISEKSNSWANSWAKGARGRKMPFGSGKMVRVRKAGQLSTMKKIDVKVDFQYDLEAAAYVFWPGDMVCRNSGWLAGGRLYVYTGGCTFKDITNFDDWDQNNTEGHRYFAQQLCGGLAESQWSDCMQYLICAVDELKWADQPSQLLHAATTHTTVAARLSCPHVGEETHAGMYHKHHTCGGRGRHKNTRANCTTGSCAFCGTEGLCCRHPGINAKFKKNGCGSLGCHGRHCCVPKSDAETPPLPAQAA